MGVTVVDHFDVSNLVIKGAKKCDESYTCRLKYNKDGSSDKVFIDFGTVQVVSAKSGSLTVKIGNKKIKKILELQQYITEYANNNAHKWFDRKIQSHVVDDMFIRVVTVHEKHGKVLKFRITSPMSTEIKGSGKLSMKLESIRFDRTSFYMLWEVSEFVSNEAYMFTDSSSDEEEEEIEVDHEEILQGAKNDILAKIEMLDRKLIDIKSNVQNANLNELEELTSWFENFFSNNNIVL